MQKDLEVKGDELYLSIVGSSKAIKIFGAMFALPGLLAWLIGLNTVFFSQESIMIEDVLKVFFLGGIFILIGCALGSLKMWVSVNKTGTAITKGTSILGVSRSTPMPISNIIRLELSQEWRSSSSSNGGSSYLVYPLKLITAIAEHNLNSSSDFSAARKQAEAVSKFLNIALSDSSSGQGFERKPSELDNKLVDSIASKIEAPRLPEDARVRLIKGEDNITLVLPARKGVVASGLLKIVFLIPAFWFISNIAGKFSVGGQDWLIPAIIFSVFILIFVFHAVKHLSPIFSPPELVLSPKEITYREIWYKKKEKLACAGIEEINTSDRGIVQVISDEGRLVLRLFDSKPDSEFVESMLMYCLQFTKKTDGENK